MPILVTGKLVLKPGQRQRFIEASLPSIALARRAKGCLDFSVSPDPLDEARVNVYEEWSDREALEAFRGEGPEDDLFALVESFDVKERELPDAVV